MFDSYPARSGTARGQFCFAVYPCNFLEIMHGKWMWCFLPISVERVFVWASDWGATMGGSHSDDAQGDIGIIEGVDHLTL